MKNVLFVILFLAVISTVACNKKRDSNKTPTVENTDEWNVNTDSVSFYLRNLITQMESDKGFEVNGELIFSYTVLPEYYKRNDFNWAWSEGINRREAAEALSKSWRDGLLPEDYHLDQIMEFANDLANEKGKLNPEKVAKLDLLLTDGVLLYAFHLIKGKLNPENYDVTWNFQTRDLPVQPADLLEDALQNQTIKKTLNTLRPGFYAYRAMLTGMDNYTKINEQGGWESIELAETLKPGQSNEAVPLLWKRLAAERFVDQIPDSLTEQYDETLVNAVKHFQESRGLNNDGNIGKNTVKALNIPVEELINKLKVNLERSRWLLDVTEQGRILLVNIAKYQAFLIENDSILYKTRVMVGKEQHKTPIFREEMKHVVFNPTWTVPRSIALRETLPKLKRDPNYLRRNNMVILNSKGEVLNDSNIDWSKYSANHFPFTVRQEPGVHNALGRVKFLFPNKYSIYLHDTPSKYLFVKDMRAFSHGCIRVENPLMLAEKILNDPEKWNQKSIKKVLDTGKQTWVPVTEPLDVLLFYWTTGPRENGELFFMDDIYNRDEKLLKSLTMEDWDNMVVESRKRASVDLKK